MRMRIHLPVAGAPPPPGRRRAPSSRPAPHPLLPAGTALPPPDRRRAPSYRPAPRPVPAAARLHPWLRESHFPVRPRPPSPLPPAPACRRPRAPRSAVSSLKMPKFNNHTHLRPGLAAAPCNSPLQDHLQKISPWHGDGRVHLCKFRVEKQDTVT